MLRFTTRTPKLPTDTIKAAGTSAVSCVLLTNVVAKGKPLHATIEPDRKPPPPTVMVKSPPPATAKDGLREVKTGVGTNTLKVTPSVPELPFSTVITTAAGATIREAGTCAVTCVLLMNVVGREVVFHCTAEAGTNPVPLTVSVKLPPPAGAPCGLIATMEKLGGAVIVNVSALEMLPSASETVMAAVPAVAISEAGTVAFSRPLFPNMVTKAELFHRTVEAEGKLLP